MIIRINKQIYRAKRERVYWPLSYERRVWKAARILVEQCRHWQVVHLLVAMHELQPGETKNGVTCLARCDGAER